MLLGLAPAWQNVLLKQACRCVALQGCCRTNTFDGLLFLRLVDEQETGALRTEGEGQDLQEGWDDGEAQQDWPESFRPQDDVQAKDLRARKREAQGGVRPRPQKPKCEEAVSQSGRISSEPPENFLGLLMLKRSLAFRRLSRPRSPPAAPDLTELI